MEHTIKELKELYIRGSKFYDDNYCFPFKNLGLFNEIQFKTYYDYFTKTLLIAWESSRPNKVHKNFKFEIDWFFNLFAVPSKLIETETKDNPIVSNFMEGFKTHSGFTLAFLSVINDINYEIQECLKHNDVEHIIIYGWSQGGVLSIMNHLWIKTIIENTEYENIDIQTFTIGTPKFIYRRLFYIFNKRKEWKKISKKLNGVHMFANRNDIFSKLPFRWMGFINPMKITKLDAPFNIFKIWHPWTYHIKDRYDKLVEEWFDKQIK